jgi:hypothetical protein
MVGGVVEGSRKAREISLGDDFGDVAVSVNGVRIEVRTDGSVLAYTKGGVDAYTNGPIRAHPAANDEVKSEAAPEIGDKVYDGTVFAGTSPDTGKAMYATPADAKLTYTFNRAKDYAATLDANGHQDWRVPTKNELNVLFQNRAAIGGFNETGSYPAGWYWSSSPLDNGGWAQRFSDGSQANYLRNDSSALRCVR